MKCETCKGSGAEAPTSAEAAAGKGSGFEKCATCDGRGEVREERRTFFGSFSQVKRCEKCHGVGEVPKKVCKVCRGAGRTESDRNIAVEIVPGIESGQIINVKGMGEAGERGTATGDLYVRVRVAPHHTFERQGANLVVAREVTLSALLRGTKVEVPTVAGGKLAVEVPGNFNLREPLRIPGEGMPRLGSHGRGDLFVNLIVKTPKKIDSKLKKILEDFKED